MVRECDTSEWTWVTIFGVSLAAATYGARYWATWAVALRRPKIDVGIVRGSIIRAAVRRACGECKVQPDVKKLKVKPLSLAGVAESRAENNARLRLAAELGIITRYNKR